MGGMFQRATKQQSKLRMAIDGPSGSGKTYTGLIFATALAGDGTVAVIDTERGSAAKYADMFTFDSCELVSFEPERYIEAIEAAEAGGYAVILIDSLSHAWEGAGGVLEQHDMATKREPGGNSYTAWRTVTPRHQALVDAILQSRCHVIVTMRSKMEYIQTEENGKKGVKRVGMAPIQRAGMEYEFDVVADMDTDHNLVVSKSRCFAVSDAVVSKPTAKWFDAIKAWLSSGAPAPAKAEPAKATEVKFTWTRNEADAFKAWLATRTLTETEGKKLAGLSMGTQVPLAKFGDFPGSREDLQAAIERELAKAVAGQAVTA